MKGRQLLFQRDCCKASKKNTCNIFIEILKGKPFSLWSDFPFGRRTDEPLVKGTDRCYVFLVTEVMLYRMRKM